MAKKEKKETLADFLSHKVIPAPFNELDSEALASDKDWGWALIFANFKSCNNNAFIQKTIP